MGFAAGFAAGYNAVDRARTRREARDKAIADDMAKADKIAKDADNKAQSDFKNITDSQLSFEDKINEEQNYKKRNALKKSYASDQERRLYQFNEIYKGTPALKKYGDMYVPYAGMEEETVIRKFGNEYVIPTSEYDMLSQRSEDSFSDNADGNLGVFTQGQDGKSTSELGKSYRRSQQKKIKAYDRDGNRVDAYEDQIEDKGLLLEKPTKEGYVKVWKNGKQVERKESLARKLVEEKDSGYSYTKPDEENTYTNKDISKKKMEISNIKRQINTSRKKGDTNTELQLEDSLEKAQDELNYMNTGEEPSIVDKKDFAPIEVIKTTTNNKAVNREINKMVGTDEKEFYKEFINTDYDAQVKMLDSGNQHASKAWMKMSNSVLQDSLDSGGREDENGYMVYPSQELNKQLAQIQDTNMNKTSKERLTKEIISDYEKISAGQDRDIDDKWYSNTFVENLINGSSTYEDADARNYSIQKIIEDKSNYGEEYMGGIQLDSSWSPFASSERFSKQSMPVIEKAYKQITGRALTPNAWKRISENGITRDSWNADLSGQAGTITEGSELDKILRLIFKSKKGK